MLTHKRLKELLHYDPETGVFTYVKSTANRIKIGDAAGSKHNAGYLAVRIDYKAYLCHRLAWFYVHGVWPKGQIDHRDTIKHHNWIDNLRDVTQSVNQQNQVKASSNNKSGFLGVRLHECGRYSAQIYVNRSHRNLGYYDTPEEASQAYLAAKRKYHEGCTV
jgi:hypothetical protein